MRLVDMLNPFIGVLEGVHGDDIVVVLSVEESIFAPLVYPAAVDYLFRGRSIYLRNVFAESVDVIELGLATLPTILVHLGTR